MVPVKPNSDSFTIVQLLGESIKALIVNIRVFTDNRIAEGFVWFPPLSLKDQP
jgi:hypothetical protein